jgi:hypothetical protein
MTVADPHDEVAALTSAVSTHLRDYGHYLAMRGTVAGEQRFGLPELAMAASSLVGWGTACYLKAYLDELGKRHATRRAPLPEPAADAAARSTHPPATASALAELRRHQHGPLRLQIEIDREALATELCRHGLSRRAARELSPRLARALEQGLATPLDGPR